MERATAFPSDTTAGKLVAVASKEEWVRLVTLIRQDRQRLGSAASSPHVRRFYECSVEQGRFLLRSFRQELGDDRLDDLIHDVLVGWETITETEPSPHAWFERCLVNRAISWKRRPAAEVVADDAGAWDAHASPDDEERRQIDRMHARQFFLERLTHTERSIMSALEFGHSREQIAEALGKSRPNVDQIISRLRKRLRELES